MSDPAKELEGLLSEPVADARHREQTAFQQAMQGSSGRVAIYGAGNLGRKVAAGLREAGVDVLAFADQNAALWSQSVHGLPVYSPEEAAAKFGDSALFLVALCHPTRTGGVGHVSKRLQTLGCHHVTSFVPLFWQEPNRYLPYFTWDLPSHALESTDRVRAGFAVFGDSPESQSVFVRQMRLRLHGDFGCLEPPPPHSQYFADLFAPRADECFVDCGAYNGDTARDFLRWNSGAFRKLVAYEPDPNNAADLQRFAQSRAELNGRVDIRTSAVGDTVGIQKFAALGTSSAGLSDAGDVSVHGTTLDTDLANESVTFIKMDIEAAEPSALRGARTIIRRDRPILAICAYHRQNHLWEIPLLMKSLLDDANFALMSYSIGELETVCYGIPQERYVAREVPSP